MGEDKILVKNNIFYTFSLFSINIILIKLALKIFYYLNFFFFNKITVFTKNIENYIMNYWKSLWVFDFDHTIVDSNSDTFIYQALPSSTLPKSIESTYVEGFWTDYMKKVFDYFFKIGIFPENVQKVLEKIPITKGFIELFNLLKNSDFSEKSLFCDIIIISDSNTLFIEWILKKSNIFNFFKEIFTNPAKIVENHIEISIFQKHLCEICPINMCKKTILKEFIKNHVYERIFYVGDGGNDYCPCHLLGERDIVFSRKGYSLEKKLKKNENEIKAKKIYWEDGYDIIKFIEENISKKI